MLNDTQYLVDILDAAKLAVSYVDDKTTKEFFDDIQCQDAVIRRIEIIGEAAGRITTQTRAALPQLDWKGMVGMRNVMIHQYQSVDLLIVWDTIQRSLPPLVAALEKYLESDREQK